MEPLEFRSVTALEEVTVLTDDDSLLLINSGTAKRIKTSNVSFGGANTVYYPAADTQSADNTDSGVSVQASSGPSQIDLTDASGSAVTAQQFYDAFISGRVVIDLYGTTQSTGSLDDETVSIVEVVAITAMSGTVTAVTGVTFTTANGNFHVGGEALNPK